MVLNKNFRETREEKKILCPGCGNEFLIKEKVSCLKHDRLTGKKRRIDLCPECVEKLEKQLTP